jgi:TM2 domain-containing membrane protein YozV
VNEQQPQVLVVRSEKSMGLAYVLLIFLGQMGIHRFYLNHVGSGITQIILGVVGWATVWIVVGWVPLAVLWLWLFIDLFLTAGMVREANRKMRVA